MDPTFKKTKKRKSLGSIHQLLSWLIWMLRLVVWSIVVAMFLRINMDFNECLVVSIAIFSRNLNKINELWFGLDLLTWTPATINRGQDFAHRCSHDPVPSPETASWGLSLETKNNTPTKTSNHWHVKQLIWREKHIRWPYMNFPLKGWKYQNHVCFNNMKESNLINYFWVPYILNLNLGKSPLPSVHNSTGKVDESPDQMDLNRLFRWGHMQPILVLTLVLKKKWRWWISKNLQKKKKNILQVNLLFFVWVFWDSSYIYYIPCSFLNGAVNIQWNTT